MAFDPTAPYEPAPSGGGFNPDAPYEPAADKAAKAAPAGTDAPAQPEAAPTDPWADEPGYAYGSILPFRTKVDDKGAPVPGTTEMAWPEIVRSPMRGLEKFDPVTGMGKDTPLYETKFNPDVFNLLTLGAGGGGGAVRPAASALEPAVGVASKMFDKATSWLKSSGTPSPHEVPPAPGAASAVASMANSAFDLAGERARPAVVQRLFDKLHGKEAPPTNELSSAVSKAVDLLVKRIQEDAKAGGKTIDQIYDEIIKGRAAGAPTILADVAGRNVQKAAGAVARAPGEASEYVARTTQERLSSAPQRLIDSVSKYISGGGGRRENIASITADQRAASQPLYNETLKPGSVAPLEKQFEGTFNDISRATAEAQDEVRAASQKLTMAQAQLSRAGEDVYLNNSALRAVREAELDLRDAQGRSQAAVEQKDAALARLREAQDAQANGERGGVWSPRIQQFVNDPIAKPGIARGMEIQRLEALAENKPFEPKDYAIDPEGNVIGVPNMRLLDAMKKGLDAMLNEYRNPDTGKLVLDERGRAIDMVRKSYIEELDAVNPTYAQARAAYAGPAALKDAMMAGEHAMKWHPEDIKKYVDGLSDGEKQAFSVGVAQYWKDAIANGGVTAAQIRKASATDYSSMMKDRVKAALGHDENFTDFVDAVTRERTALESANRRTGGSPTAERLEDQEGHDAAVSAARAAAHAASHNWLSAGRAVLDAKTQLGLRHKPAMNSELARLLFDPNLDLTQGAGLEALLRASGSKGAPVTLPKTPPGTP